MKSFSFFRKLLSIPVASMDPSLRFWNISPVRFLFSLSLNSSAGVNVKFSLFIKHEECVYGSSCLLPASAGRYWKSIGSLTSRSEGRRSCILTLMGSERLVSRYGGVRNTMATCLWTSAWENVPFPSQESWKKRTSMSSAGRNRRWEKGEMNPHQTHNMG